jgi:hypothetical protein
MFVDAILYYYYTIQSIIEATIIKPYLLLSMLNRPMLLCCTIHSALFSFSSWPPSSSPFTFKTYNRTMHGSCAHETSSSAHKHSQIHQMFCDTLLIMHTMEFEGRFIHAAYVYNRVFMSSCFLFDLISYYAMLK